MKNKIIFLLCLAFLSCKKEDQNSNNNNNNNDNSDAVSITSWSPEKPMWGEIVEIMGTGFPTNKDDVQVFFPLNWRGFLNDSLECLGTVISSTPTKLTVRVPFNTQTIATGALVQYKNEGYGTIVIDVKNKPRLYDTKNIYYTARPFINLVQHTTFVGGPLSTAEKFELVGTGLGTTKDDVAVYVAGVRCTIDTLFENTTPNIYGIGCKKLWATIPPNVGKVTDYGSAQLMEFKVIHKGIVTIKHHSVYLCPKLKVFGHNLGSVMNTPTKELFINGEHLFAQQLEFFDAFKGALTTNAGINNNAIDATTVNSIVPMAQFNLRPPGFYTYNVYLFNYNQPFLRILLGNISVIVP